MSSSSSVGYRSALMWKVFGGFVLTMLLCPSNSAAQMLPASEGGSERAQRTAFEPKVRPAVEVVRTSAAITIDGKLDDPGWAGATRITGFTEIQPGDEQEPQVHTEVLVAYDETRLYLGFIAHDDPDKVRASLRNRDEIFQDDWVGIILDPYGDAVQAYEIFANPLGVQGDLLMASNGNEDVGFDLVYYTEGRVTDSGYEVEMAIPFSSLRFPSAPVHTWRISFLRNRPRGSRYLYSWATVNRDDPCLLCQLGTVTGITDIVPGTNLDLIPAIVGSQVGQLDDGENPTSGFDNGRIDAEPSLNLRYNFTPSLAAEATFNPDFSQVESDVAQIDVNSTFALSYPERRPFFQEGSDLFDTWMDIVYTRSINNPLAAAKLTGRTGRWSLAYLGALDEETPVLLPFEERSATLRGGRSTANVLRARRTFGENSFAGATFTDRRLLEGGSNTLGSVDARIQFLKNYRLEAQLALNATHEAQSTALTRQDSSLFDLRFDRGVHTAAFDGERFRGTGVFLSFDRSAELWNFDLAYEASSPTFRTGNGFVTRNDYRRFRMFQGLDLYPEWSFVDALFPAVSAMREYNFDGVRKEDYAEASLFARLKGQTGVYLEYGAGRERFQDVEFEGLRGWVVDVYSQFSEPVSLGFYVAGGREIYRDGLEVGRALNYGGTATLKPHQRLVIEPLVRYSSLRNRATDEVFFSGYILRLRTSIQFTRELSLRLVTQYNDFDEQFDVEPLLSYRINPFSVFYVGSTHDYRAFDAPHGLMQTERQLFFKFQYLFRL